MQRDLVAHVLALDEPYRTAILWRYVEELSPRAIARRQGVPVRTVHTRLERGLARLRDRLRGSRGGPEAWLGAFLALSPARLGVGRFSFRFPGGTRHTLVAWGPWTSSSGPGIDRFQGRAEHVSAGTSDLELVLSKP